MNLSVESLARLTEEGRVEPQLAEKWTLTDDGRVLIVTLKSGVNFHDGTPLTAEAIATILPTALQSTMGPVIEDVEDIRATAPDTVEIRFHRPSPLLLEALEVTVRKPGQAIVATGPFRAAPDSTTELDANDEYYGGAPHIRHISINTFPSMRTAWAELLRNRIDMLYEVGPDALDSLETSTSIAVFKYTQRYQYSVALNNQAPVFRSSTIRRALNLAIDRPQLVRQALNQHGVPSSGPFWPKYWALQSAAPLFDYDPQTAAAALKGKSLRFTCLIPSDQIYERIALELKRQLAAVGVDMNVRATSPDELFEAQKQRKYEAVLLQGISGPTVLRLYQLWHSAGTVNMGGFGNHAVDAAFHRVRHAETEPAYRRAVAELHDAFGDDPPAIFLAWLERARAVSKRFVVPSAEPGRDIVGTLRLWTPRHDARFANPN